MNHHSAPIIISEMAPQYFAGQCLKIQINEFFSSKGKMQPLTALDASFLYLESDHSPMHIGSIYLMDAAAAPKGFGYAVFREHIRSRLRCSGIFRQRLVEVPFGLSYPCWINDPEFDLDLHLPRKRLIAPGGKAELMDMAAEIFAHRLDRLKPLWELSFVEGVDNFPGLAPGSFAMISKVHHAAIDGASGAELMGALLDVTDTPRTIPGNDDWLPEEVPGALSLVAGAYAQIGGKAMELGNFVSELVAGSARLRRARKVEKISPPPTLFSAPKSPFNVNITTRRKFWGLDFAFDRIRHLRGAVAGTTINDVVLAVCAGALRAYLLKHDSLPDEQMVAMAPISVHEANTQSTSKGSRGNQVSAMLVGLATDMADPLQRLRQIHRNTRSSKLYSSALPANKITEFIPSETAAAAVRLYTRTRLGGRHRPFFNLVITNVPGPPVPLYLAGARVSAHFGMAPVLDGLGLIIVVFTYAGRISFGLTAGAKILPDPEHLEKCFRQSLADLEAAIDNAEQAGEAGQSAKLATAKPTEINQEMSPAENLQQAMLALDEAMETMTGETITGKEES